MLARVVAVSVILAGGVSAASTAGADEIAQPLPFTQSWSDTAALLDHTNDWSGVPGIIGRRGGGLVSTVGVDPRTVLLDGAGTPHDVHVNMGNPGGLAFGGLAEFEIADPVIGIQPASAADAPHLIIALDTSSAAFVRVAYDLRDLDGSNDDVPSAVALHYRIGSSGDFTNVPGAFVADASEGGTAGKVTHVDVTLPGIAGGQSRLELRLLMTNRQGQDEWIGVDNIAVTAATGPSGIGTADPAVLAAGETSRLRIVARAGDAATTDGLTVTCDISAIGGPTDRPLFDDGEHGDGEAHDGLFSRQIVVRPDTAAGLHILPCQITDTQGRENTVRIRLEVVPVCGDGRAEDAEICDDGNAAAGDGCSACAIDAGWSCADGAPTMCADIDECTIGADDCAPLAGCTNQPGGYACACAGGYAGDGHDGDGGTGCTEIDECATDTDDCASLATCTNLNGDFACTCAPGYGGDGHEGAGGTGCVDINECVDQSAGCSVYATCINSAGDVQCVCAPGFGGDGHTCAPVCGDGLVILDETCDDAGTDDGDGCDATCQIEDGFTCQDVPSTCIADRDADGIDDLTDNCPAIDNPDQADDDGDGAGSACDADEDTSPEPPGGCGCATTTGGATWPLALLVALLLLRRKRRRLNPRSR